MHRFISTTQRLLSHKKKMLVAAAAMHEHFQDLGPNPFVGATPENDINR